MTNSNITETEDKIIQGINDSINNTGKSTTSFMQILFTGSKRNAGEFSRGLIPGLWQMHTRRLTFAGTATVAGAIYGGLWANPATVAALHAILLKAMPFLAPLIKANPVLGTFLLVALAILAVAFTAYLGASIYAGIRDKKTLTESDEYKASDNNVSSLLRAGIFGLTGRVVKSFELSCCENSDDMTGDYALNI